MSQLSSDEQMKKGADLLRKWLRNETGIEKIDIIITRKRIHWVDVQFIIGQEVIAEDKEDEIDFEDLCFAGLNERNPQYEKLKSYSKKKAGVILKKLSPEPALVNEEMTKEKLLRERWKGEEDRIQKICEFARKGEDWTVHLKALPFVEEIGPLAGEKYGRDLRGAPLNGADLREANLRGADLSAAILKVANLSGADLGGANLSVSKLFMADLSKTNLSEANLSAANLSAANLHKADLSNAKYLEEAVLYGASLEDANLEGTGFEWHPGGLRKATSAMSHVFISYVRENLRDVTRLRLELEEAGIKVWLDRKDIEAGEDWKSAIRKAIRGGDCFLACFSEEYNLKRKTYMNSELMLAIDELMSYTPDHRWFIPVLLSRCEIPDISIGGNRTLRDLQHVKLYEDWGEGVRRILSVIRKDRKR